jgi:hypothetical protein
VVPASAVKLVATDESEALIARCAGVLGARAVIAAGPTGVVQKAQRDNAIVRVIDTSTVGNLRTVAAQIPLLAGATAGDADPGVTELIFDLGRELPGYDPTALDLTTRGHDHVLAALPAIAEQARWLLTERCEHSEHSERYSRNEPAAGRAAELIGELAGDVAALLHDPTGDDQLRVAERFCHLYAAASCLHLWWFNRTEPLYGRPPGSTGWLTGCLAYLLARARRTDPREAAADAAGALDAVLDRHARNRLFSAVDVRLAGQRPA